MCATYPTSLLVPTRVGDALIASTSSFRSKSRCKHAPPVVELPLFGIKPPSARLTLASIPSPLAVPCVVWVHPSGRLCLARASQPRSGVFGAHSEADEHLVSQLRAAEPLAASGTSSHVTGELVGKRLVICDARPFVNAVGNKGKGGGVENVSRYFASFACQQQEKSGASMPKLIDVWCTLLWPCFAFATGTRTPRWSTSTLTTFTSSAMPWWCSKRRSVLPRPSVRVLPTARCRQLRTHHLTS